MRKEAIESLGKISGEKLRVNTMLENMHSNKAYQFNLTNNKKRDELLLKNLKDNYLKLDLLSIQLKIIGMFN